MCGSAADDIRSSYGVRGDSADATGSDEYVAAIDATCTAPAAEEKLLLAGGCASAARCAAACDLWPGCGGFRYNTTEGGRQVACTALTFAYSCQHPDATVASGTTTWYQRVAPAPELDSTDSGSDGSTFQHLQCPSTPAVAGFAAVSNSNCRISESEVDMPGE